MAATPPRTSAGEGMMLSIRIREKRTASKSKANAIRLRADPKGARTEAIRHVVRFGSKLHTLGFAETKYARQADIELPCCRQLKNGAAQISKSSQSRLCERRGIQPLRIWPPGCVEVYVR